MPRELQFSMAPQLEASNPPPCFLNEQGMAADPPPPCPPIGVTKVLLHIYDVSQNASIQWLNSLMAPGRLPFKFGGIFHAGIEVDGSEWVFGWAEQGTGVYCSTPRKQSDHHFRETLELPRSPLPPHRVREVIDQLQAEYTGESYDILRRNCCHFADELCRRIGVGPIPRWVSRLAIIGDRACDGIDAMYAVCGVITQSCAKAGPQSFNRMSCARSRSPKAQRPRGCLRHFSEQSLNSLVAGGSMDSR